MPALPSDLAAALPDAIERALLALSPGDPAEVLKAVRALAGRRGFELPDDLALEMDVEVMASWPRDLFRQAFRRIWETFEYRRLPEVADFHKHIADDLEARRLKLHRLESVRLRLETLLLKEKWDREAHEYGIKLRERERAS
ncbi:hypothetical protein GGE65_006233 [Skermanella aerolata]|uniref:hypothetical protein n=1 Tax=Skermanella aerolata TaxID=393310 RepID=UPI003D223D0C